MSISRKSVNVMRVALLIMGLSLFFFSKAKHDNSKIVLDYIRKDTIKHNNITARIEGLSNDTLLVIYNALSFENGLNVFVDTIVAHQGRFVYKLPLNKPALVRLYPKKALLPKTNGGFYRPLTKQITVFLTPATRIEITGALCNDYLNYSIHGDQVNEQYVQVRKNAKLLETDLVKHDLKMDTLLVRAEKKQASLKLLADQRKQLEKKIQNLNLRFIKAHLQSELSAYLLSSQPLDTVGRYYGKLNAKAKQGRFSEWLDFYWKNFQRSEAVNQTKVIVQVNNKAPDFNLPTVEGKNFVLSEVNGKYIVLDFWGSWCLPCLAGLPKMKQIYEKYHSRLEMIGIACEDNQKDWRKAVQKYGCNWIQLYNSPENDVSIRYAVEGYPTKIILDKDHKIIGRFTGESEAFYQALEGLFK